MQATGTGYKITSSPNTASSLPAETTIDGGDFWPDIEPKDFRAAMRIDGTVTAERTRSELVNAIATTRALLASWGQEQQQAGSAPFDKDAADAVLIDGEAVATLYYRRAVYCFAAAQLQERYQTFDNTAEGDKRAEADNTLIDALRRDAHWAVSDLLGRLRSTVDLI